jgi:hypothetical protein
MTQLSSGTLRVRAGADTLLIGERAAFGHGRGLCRLESEDEVRRRLIQAMADRSSLESLRAFWARWQFDTQRITHTPDRVLIDRVAVMTVRGPLAAYVVPDASVNHVLGSAIPKVTPRRPMRGAAASSTPGATSAAWSPVRSPAAGVGAPPALAAVDGPMQVSLMTLEQRVVEVLHRAASRLPPSLWKEAAKLFEPAMAASTAQVLTVWAGTHVIGAGFLLEAILLADGLVARSWVAAETSEKIDESLAIVRQARNDWQLDEAADLLADAISLLGIPAFIAAIWRGANRFSSQGKKGRR